MHPLVVLLSVLMILLTGLQLWWIGVVGNDALNTANQKLLDSSLVRGETLQAPAAQLTQSLIAWKKVANSTKFAFLSENMPCHTAFTTNSVSRFLQSTLAIQLGFVELTYVYVSYDLGGGMGWGDCGCDNDGNCMFTDLSGNQNSFHGANFSDPIPDGLFYNPTENLTYTQEIKALRQSDSDGVWIMPSAYYEPLTNVTSMYATFTIPLTFDINGNCNLAVSVDVDVSNFISYLTPYVQPSSTIVMVDTRTPQGIFLAATNQPFNLSTDETLYGAAGTPSPMINAISSALMSKLGGVAGTVQFSTGNGGTEYSAYAVPPVFNLYQGTPQSAYFTYRDSKMDINFEEEFGKRYAAIIIALTGLTLLVTLALLVTGACFAATGPAKRAAKDEDSGRLQD